MLRVTNQEVPTTLSLEQIVSAYESDAFTPQPAKGIVRETV